MTRSNSRGTLRRRLLAGVVSSCAAASVHAAHAAAADAAAAADRSADNGGGARVEEVMVTARKRSESVEKVPIAITALTGELKNADIRDLTDVVAFTPNVRIDSYAQRAGAVAITIRGISPSRLDDNSIDSPIGVLIDGIYLGTLTGQDLPNFDLDRIEVLRGPQGTLFGRNTIGGALNIVRTEPTGEWGAKLQYTTGSWNDQEFKAVFNAPIIQDKLALKLYWISENRDGYLHNTFLGINQPQKNYKNFGGVLKFTPNDRFKALLTVEKYEDRSQGGAFLGNYNTAAGVLPAPTGASDINAPGTALAGTGGAEIATFLPAAFGLPNVPARTSLAIPSSITDNYPSPGDVQTWAYSLNMNYRLSDNISLVSITGFREQHEMASEDFDGSSANFINIATDAHYHQFSQELRAEGNWDGPLGKLNLVAGAYYWNSYFTRRWVTSGDFWNFVTDISGYNLNNNTWVNPGYAAATGYADPLAACLSPVPRVNPATSKTGTPQQNGLWNAFGRVQCDPGGPQGGTPGAGGYGPGIVNILYESQNTDSEALFAHGDWEFYPHVTLTAGVRYTYETKHFIGYQSYLAPLDRANVNDFPGNADLTKSWGQVTPTAGLAWQATQDVMVYGSFSEGWHSGGFFGVNQNTADFQSNQYVPETSQSYEVGMKGQFFDHRVQFNLAGFLTDFQNKQESAIEFDNTTNTVVTVFTNVGGLEYKGIEGELQWIVNRQLSFAGSFGYLNARYTSLMIGYPGNQTGQVPIVNATFLVPRDAPDVTFGASATYAFEVGPGMLSLGAKIDWVDRVYGDLYDMQNAVVPAHSDVSLDASYSWKRYKITVFGRDVNNWRWEYPVFIAPLFASSTITPGANWGVQLDAQF